MTELFSLFLFDEQATAFLCNNIIMQQIQLGQGTLFSEKSFTINIKYKKKPQSAYVHYSFFYRKQFTQSTVFLIQE